MGVTYLLVGRGSSKSRRWQTLWVAMLGLLPALFLQLGTIATHRRKWFKCTQRPLRVQGPGASTL